jgi:enoyl-CoA hydratase/carnithine racemase
MQVFGLPRHVILKSLVDRGVVTPVPTLRRKPGGRRFRLTSDERHARPLLMPTALDYARRIAANAPLAVQAAKELALRSRDVDLATGLRLEQLMLRLLQTTEDVKEGSTAFSEKRPPRFTGA